MSTSPIIVWIRRDLRLCDNPALHKATEYDAPIIPLFIWSPEEEEGWPMGGAHKWWLHHSLYAFASSLSENKSKLTLRVDDSIRALARVLEETGATSVFWNSAYEPAERKRDQQVSEALQELGIETKTFESHLLHDPEQILTTSGTPYKVYTPFWKNISENLSVSSPLEEVPLSDTHAPDEWPESVSIDELDLLPEIDWAEGLRNTWKPGEADAHCRLDRFMDGPLLNYEKNRDLPELEGTSRLSPHLQFGEISPRMIWHTVSEYAASLDNPEATIPFLKQLIWREFSYHLLYHFPETAENNLRGKFNSFPWLDDTEALERWQKGETGYPIVDAGMRQLWATGWMHNRVRMIAASFLTKHLLTHWLEGARWFWDTLVDANLANNTMGWQWAAGSGADAQPFFRIFNPITQGEKFDAEGNYIKHWIPELKEVPPSKLHEPWTLSSNEQKKAGVTLGSTYPHPIVHHKEARERALSAYEKVKG